MNSVSLEESRDWCHELMRSAARNFYFGMSLLPADKRNAMFALYAFMRHIDDIADSSVDAGVSKATAAAALEIWRDATHAVLKGEDRPHPMFPALRQAVRRFCIPHDLLDAAIDGQIQDMKQSAYRTFDELKQYCYRVASTVGIAAVYIWGFKDAQTIALADDRGVAFQLTNILRDIREDNHRGRVYLPQEDMARFGVDLKAALAGRDRARFVEMMRFQVARAQEYYDRSAPLENMVDPDARPTLRVMTRIYHGILGQIAADPAAILERRVGLSSAAKMVEVARELWRAQTEGEA